MLHESKRQSTIYIYFSNFQSHDLVPMKAMRNVPEAAIRAC